MITTDTHRWLGLASYEERDAEIFYGREKEIEELAGDIFHNTQTVIYGPSGTGKTSIIRAGIFKKAREQRYFPVYIRLNHETGELYFRQIIQEIQEHAATDAIEIEQRVEYIGEQCNSLWEFFHCNVFWNADNYPVIPLVVIDQFEELFTISKDSDNTANFFEQLSDLCDDKYPHYIKEHLSNQNRERIQYPEKINYRCVISLREDFLARLEEHANNIPALKRNRYSLQAINEEQAMDIIMKPAEGIVTTEVAIEIIQKVTNRKDFKIDGIPEIIVEPALLSLFCNELDKKRAENGLQSISLDLVREFGDNIIKDFYARVMSQIRTETVSYLEDNLLTGDGFRDNVALKDAFKNQVSKNELDFLQKNRLIRIEEWDGTKRIEFTHDVLCKVAMEHRNDREKQRCLKEEQEKMLALKRRNRFMLIAIVVGVGVACGISIFIWDGYYRAIEQRYANCGKRTGWLIGWEELTSDQASYLPYHYVFKKKGRLAKHWLSMEARNGYDKPTTQHSMDTYILNPHDEEDKGADEEMKQQLQSVCRWELVADATGNFLVQERAYDQEGKLIYCYNRCQTDNPQQVVGTYTDGLGFPIRMRNNAGYSYILVTYDDRGLETLFEFYDEDGYMQANKDGAYKTEKKYLDNGIQIEEASLNIDGRRTKDRWGNCGWKAVYEGFKEVTSTSVDEEGKPWRTKIGGKTITRKWRYDSFGRRIEETYWDENGQPDINNDGVHGYEYAYNRYGQYIHCYRVGRDGKRCADNAGWLDYHREYDPHGNEILNEMIGRDSIIGTRSVYSATDELLEEFRFRVMHEDTTCLYSSVKNPKENTLLKYFKDDCSIRAQYDEKNRLIYWAYFDTLNVQPVMRYGYHRNQMEYRDTANFITCIDTYYDTDNKLCIADGYDFARQVSKTDSLMKTDIISRYDTLGNILSSYKQQYDETFTRIIAQQSLSFNNEPERNWGSGPLYYRVLLNYSIKPTLDNNKWNSFIGINEYNEPSLIKGGNLLYYRSKFDSMGNTVYFDENGEEITDMEQYIARTPKVLSVALKDSSALQAGFRSNDILVGCNQWKMYFAGTSNDAPFDGLADILFANSPRRLTLMRFFPDEKRHKIVEIEMPKECDISQYVNLYYVYYTKTEKERLEKVMQMENVMQEYLPSNSSDTLVEYKESVIVIRPNLQSGQAYRAGMREDGILLEWNDWDFYSDVSGIKRIMEQNESKEKKIVFINRETGEIETLQLGAGKIGVRVLEVFVTRADYDAYKRQYKRWKSGAATQ